jgi:hypothetical protein
VNSLGFGDGNWGEGKHNNKVTIKSIKTFPNNFEIILLESCIEDRHSKRWF